MGRLCLYALGRPVAGCVQAMRKHTVLAQLPVATLDYLRCTQVSVDVHFARRQEAYHRIFKSFVTYRF
jgi:hypothetical protein